MKISNKIKTIFFDLDHTLWDFEKNSFIAYKKIFVKYDFPFSLKLFMKYYIPINDRYWYEYSRNRISKDKLRTNRLIETFQLLKFNYDKALVNEISDLYINILPKQTFLFDGVIDLLEFLKPKYKMHILTNGFEHVQFDKMKYSGLLPFFDKIINSDNACSKKPDSKIFNYALELTNQKAENCLMIGNDIDADIMGALNVGMDAVHFNSKNVPYHSKCKIVYSMQDLYELFKNK